MARKIPAFKIDELDFGDDSEESQSQSRRIFEVLKQKAIKREFLSEHEKEFFCTGVKLSLLNDGTWEDYECCENPKFKFLYLTYFRDLTGATPVFKPRQLQLEKVMRDEVERDLAFLDIKAKEWDALIMKSNHPEEMLNQISKETRLELKAFNKQYDIISKPYIKWTYFYEYKKKAILLHSRYIYCIALEIFETLEVSDRILEINNEAIEFNEFSLIHIVNRHYSEVAKQFDTKKTFHNEDFRPRILPGQLKDILNEIDKSNWFKEMPIDKIAFQLNGDSYLIWTSLESRSVKGKGIVNYRRLNTFYRITDTTELTNLNKYSLRLIRDGLYVYTSN